MGALMSNPAFLGTVPALVAAFIAASPVVTRHAWARNAVAAIVVGFLIGFLFIEELPPLPPVTAKQKLFFVAVALLLLGIFFDAGGIGRRTAVRLQWLVPLVILAWLAWRLLGDPDLRFAGEFIALFAASGFVLWRLRRAGDGGALGPGTQLLVAAAGFSVIAVVGGSASLGMLASSVAAATGAVLVWAYGASVLRDTKLGFGAAGWLGGGGTLMTVAATTVLFTEGVNRIALAVLLLVFLADQVPLPVPGGLAGRVVRPVALGIVAAIPAAAAVAIAVLLGDDSPY